jgi:hypothetical protein
MSNRHRVATGSDPGTAALLRGEPGGGLDRPPRFHAEKLSRERVQRRRRVPERRDLERPASDLLAGLLPEIGKGQHEQRSVAAGRPRPAEVPHQLRHRHVGQRVPANREAETPAAQFLDRLPGGASGLAAELELLQHRLEPGHRRAVEAKQEGDRFHVHAPVYANVGRNQVLVACRGSLDVGRSSGRSPRGGSAWCDRA